MLSSKSSGIILILPITVHSLAMLESDINGRNAGCNKTNDEFVLRPFRDLHSFHASSKVCSTFRCVDAWLDQSHPNCLHVSASCLRARHLEAAGQHLFSHRVSVVHLQTPHSCRDLRLCQIHLFLDHREDSHSALAVLMDGEPGLLDQTVRSRQVAAPVVGDWDLGDPLGDRL